MSNDTKVIQYVDDTIFIGETFLANRGTIKTILRCFGLASGLHVNFFKSSIMGVNVDSNFLSQVESFLHCRVASILFRYLSLLGWVKPKKDWDITPFS